MLRRIAWSKALSEYLRGDCHYHWIPIDQILRHFDISRSMLDWIINERMSVRSTSKEVDGITVVTEEIKGNSSTRSSRSHGGAHGGADMEIKGNTSTGSTWRS